MGLESTKTRRGNHEGTITERNGSYRAQVSIHGKRRSVTAKTKTELRRKMRELQVNADKGILPATDRQYGIT